MDTFQRLPFDILTDIFEYYVHDRSKSPGIDESQAPARHITAYPDSQTDPVDLTHVCRSWRATAISIPRLWATIYTFGPRSRAHVKIFKLWLERSAGLSGSYPLDLTIKQSLGGLKASPLKFLKQIIALAISQHQRWRYISLELHAKCKPFFEPLYEMAPLSILRRFKLNLQEWEKGDLRHLLRFLCSSPELRSITLGKEFAEDRSIIDIVPWSRLASLAFLSLSNGSFLRILSSSMDTLPHISVSDLIITSKDGDADNSTAIAHTTMRCLQSIHINAFSEDPFWYLMHRNVVPPEISEVWDSLILPSLRELRLPTGWGHFDSPLPQKRGWESLLSLLERSNCKLEAFEFGNDKMPELTKILESHLFEHLTNLRVTKVGRTRHQDCLQLLDALSEVCEDTQEPRMLPLLETLVLDSVCSVERVREMVSARVAAYGGFRKSKLRRVCAEFTGKGFVLDMDLTSQIHAW